MSVTTRKISIPMEVEKVSGGSSGESISPAWLTYGTASLAMRQNIEDAKKRRKKKKKSEQTLATSSFSDMYTMKGEVLGEGSYGKVETCVNIYTNIEYAVKTIEKRPGFYSRSKVMKEIEIFHICQGHENIIQLFDYFEENDRFYLIFEKILGGPLLDHIQARTCFTEAEASAIIRDLANALKFLHGRGIAHRDVKPENVLCKTMQSPCHVKLCDFDLCSEAYNKSSTPHLLTPVGSCEYMAPEVVDTFIAEDADDDDEENQLYYDKKCDLWSLGVIMYILLCGYPPFSGNCGSDCGWDQGETCPACQSILFTSIKEGRVVFLNKDWSGISTNAKDLISSLLVKDVSSRLDTEEVLEHPWIASRGCSNPLNTPRNLKRQTSVQELVEFAASAVAVNRALVEERDLDTVNPRAVKIPFQKAYSSCSTFDKMQSSSSISSRFQRRRQSKTLRSHCEKISRWELEALYWQDTARPRFFVEDLDFSSNR